jgi:putative addiction module component (TIGR02574 family)
MASVSLRDLGIDRLSIEERLQVADAIWDSVMHEVETSPLPEWQRAELERRLADSVVNPDAVLRGSKIWKGEWSQQRAASNKIAVDELEEHYRKRSLLQRSVFPEDIAEGVYFFASDLSNKSTGNFLNVDAGNAVSFTR